MTPVVALGLPAPRDGPSHRGGDPAQRPVDEPVEHRGRPMTCVRVPASCVIAADMVLTFDVRGAADGSVPIERTIRRSSMAVPTEPVSPACPGQSGYAARRSGSCGASAPSSVTYFQIAGRSLYPLIRSSSMLATDGWRFP